MNKPAHPPPSGAAPRGRMPALQSVTLVDQVVDAIVQGACEGRFRPGDRVVEAEVARELGVSRVPVREALRLLESQGIVINAPHRGMRLMSVDAAHLRQILIVRSSLERLAVPEAAAALRRDSSLRRGLDVHLAAMADAASAGDSFALALADIAFHRAICALADNEVLLQLWDTLARRLTIIFGLAARMMDLGQVHGAHLVLLDLLVTADPDDVSRTLDRHIMEALHLLRFEETKP